MWPRPKSGETEEDLLKQQEEFLKSLGKEQSTNIKTNENEQERVKSIELCSEIKEKFPDLATFEYGNKTSSAEGFPLPFLIDSNLVSNKKGRKSLFAIEMEKKWQLKKKIKDTEVENNDLLEYGSNDYTGQVELKIDTDFEEIIQSENSKKLSQLSKEQILEEKRKLMTTLDPSLIKFLKNRHEEKKMKMNLSEENDRNRENGEDKNYQSSTESVKMKLEQYIDSRWLNIDFVEKEKLEWIGDIPDKKFLEPNKPYSARFNFKGELQPFKTDIDVRSSLYHHGDEADRPGYTIEELYQLSRSQVLQQRILALNTLACIIRKTKLGYYDRCFDGQLLHKLVESDLFFLLRFSIDENALVNSSVYCLHNLFCNESDEFCLDKLLGVTFYDEQPFLFNNIKASKEEEEELKDHVLISCDLIKGVLRTDLLVRITYILNNCSIMRETIVRIINCLIRFSRHSSEATWKILRSGNLLDRVYSNLTSKRPASEGMKLFRVMASQSKDIAKEIIQSFDVKFFVSFVEAEENSEITKKEFYLLKLETFFFWRTLLLHNLFIDEFVSWSSSLIRLLLFYVQKVDVDVDNDFDFELFSAMASLINVCSKKKVTLDANVVTMMRVCLEKWLTQLMQFQQFSFSVAKAIGCVFKFFSLHPKAFEATAADVAFLNKINSILRDFFHNEVFHKMLTNLNNHSCILNYSIVTRDPENLPSLCSVYNDGNDYLKIVQSGSPLPFFLGLYKYLKLVSGITRDIVLIKLFVESKGLQAYLKNICECRIIFNWFMKYETWFLIGILKLFVIVDDERILFLGFRLLPMLRTDDKKLKRVFQIIFDRNSWKSDCGFMGPLNSLYCEKLCEENMRNYKNNLISQEWMYKVLADFRDADAVVSVSNVLKFISFVLNERPQMLERVSPTAKYYYLCYVFMREENIFESEIQNSLDICFRDVIKNREKINLNLKLDKNKSFYDLYTELVIQYAGVSYGLPIFAKFVLFPLQNNQNISFRKLLWFEYLHVHRVITLPFPVENFIELKAFIQPLETDESLLVAYINSIKNNVITKVRNPFVYQIAVGNIRNFLMAKNQDQRLLNFMRSKIENLHNDELKSDILNFSIEN